LNGSARCSHKLGGKPVQKRVFMKMNDWLGEEWMNCFEGITSYHLETGETVLQGTVEDLAAFYGLVEKIRNLGVKLTYLHYY